MIPNVKLCPSVEALLPFNYRESIGRRILLASPSKPFKPLGLMLWDVGSLSVEARIGNQPQAGFLGSVPARWYTTSQNFEQVVKAIAQGKEPGSPWGPWDVVYPGIDVALIFDGDASKIQALMWGHSI